MKTKEFEGVFDNLPDYEAVFEVTKVPNMYDNSHNPTSDTICVRGGHVYALYKGDVLVYKGGARSGRGRSDHMLCLRNNRLYSPLGASYLKFLGYVPVVPVDPSKVISLDNFKV